MSEQTNTDLLDTPATPEAAPDPTITEGLGHVAVDAQTTTPNKPIVEAPATVTAPASTVIAGSEHPFASKWGRNALIHHPYTNVEGGYPIKLRERAHAVQMYRTRKDMGPIRGHIQNLENGPYKIDPKTGKSKERIDGSLKHLGKPLRKSIEKTEEQYAKVQASWDKKQRKLTHGGIDEFNKAWEQAQKNTPTVIERSLVEIKDVPTARVAYHGLASSVVAERARRAGQKGNDLENQIRLLRTADEPDLEKIDELKQELIDVRTKQGRLHRKAQKHNRTRTRLKNRTTVIDATSWYTGNNRDTRPYLGPLRPVNVEPQNVEPPVEPTVAAPATEPEATPADKNNLANELETQNPTDTFEPQYRGLLNIHNVVLLHDALSQTQEALLASIVRPDNMSDQEFVNFKNSQLEKVSQVVLNRYYDALFGEGDIPDEIADEAARRLRIVDNALRLISSAPKTGQSTPEVDTRPEVTVELSPAAHLWQLVEADIEERAQKEIATSKDDPKEIYRRIRAEVKEEALQGLTAAERADYLETFRVMSEEAYQKRQAARAARVKTPNRVGQTSRSQPSRSQGSRGGSQQPQTGSRQGTPVRTGQPPVPAASPKPERDDRTVQQKARDRRIAKAAEDAADRARLARFDQSREG